MTAMGKKSILTLLLCFIASFIAFSVTPGVSYGQEEEVQIVIAPSVIFTSGTANADYVTVHTNIPFEEIDDDVSPGNASLTQITENCADDLVGEDFSIEMAWYKSDDRGYFVAKFSIKTFLNMALCINGWNDFIIEGYKDDDTSFYSDKDTILVKDGEKPGVPEDPEDPEDPEKDQNRNRVNNSKTPGQNGK